MGFMSYFSWDEEGIFLIFGILFSLAGYLGYISTFLGISSLFQVDIATMFFGMFLVSYAVVSSS